MSLFGLQEGSQLYSMRPGNTSTQQAQGTLQLAGDLGKVRKQTKLEILATNSDVACFAGLQETVWLVPINWQGQASVRAKPGTKFVGQICRVYASKTSVQVHLVDCMQVPKLRRLRSRI